VVESSAKVTPTIMNMTHRARQISNSFLMANISSIFRGWAAFIKRLGL